MERRNGLEGARRRPAIQILSGGGSPGSPVRIALRLRREIGMTLGWITQRLQMGIKTYLPHRLYGQGGERRKKRGAD